MKPSRILAPAIAAITIAATSACREAPINGHLDGQWQIMSVEYSDGQTLAPDRYYFCFYRHTANLTHYGETHLGANISYTPESKSLIIDIPAPNEWLGGWGINRHSPTSLDFQIVSLSRKHLIMTLDSTATFTLRKF